MITITENEASQIADTLTREGWTARATCRRFLTGWLVECSHPPEIPIPINVSDLATARRMLRRISQPAFPAVVPDRVLCCYCDGTGVIAGGGAECSYCEGSGTR